MNDITGELIGTIETDASLVGEVEDSQLEINVTINGAGPKGDPGVGLQYEWVGSRLGVKTEAEPNFKYVDLAAAPGPSMTGDSIVTEINASSSLIDDDNLSQRVRDAVSKAHDTHSISDVTGLQGALDAKTITKTSDLTNDSGFLTSVTKSDVGLSNVDNVKQMPISGGVLENYREKLTTVIASSGTINLNLGNVFVHTPSGNRIYSINNAVNGQAHSFTLIINQPAAVRTLTFPSSVKWQGGEIPDMSTANKTYVLTFMTVDGGTNWLGMFGGEF